jgi:hypothetical protein
MDDEHINKKHTYTKIRATQLFSSYPSSKKYFQIRVDCMSSSSPKLRMGLYSASFFACVSLFFFCHAKYTAPAPTARRTKTATTIPPISAPLRPSFPPCPPPGAVGTEVGNEVGHPILLLGATVGVSVSFFPNVGANVYSYVGAGDTGVGNMVNSLGAPVGVVVVAPTVGTPVGGSVASAVGSRVGSVVGSVEGSAVSAAVGKSVGVVVGESLIVD